MKTLLFIILLVTQPQYNFKTTSKYIQDLPATPKYESNINYNQDPLKVSGAGWIDWYVWGYWNGVPSSVSNEDMYGYYYYI